MVTWWFFFVFFVFPRGMGLESDWISSCSSSSWMAGPCCWGQGPWSCGMVGISNFNDIVSSAFFTKKFMVFMVGVLRAFSFPSVFALFAINCFGGCVRLPQPLVSFVSLHSSPTIGGCHSASASVSMHLPPSFGGCVCLFGPFPLCFVHSQFLVSMLPSPRNLCLRKRLGLWSLKAEGLRKGPFSEAVVMWVSRARVQQPWSRAQCHAGFARSHSRLIGQVVLSIWGRARAISLPQDFLDAEIPRPKLRLISHRAFLRL